MNDASFSEEREIRFAQDDRDRSFMALGACSGMSPQLFFPNGTEDFRAARLVCQGCEVRAQCEKYGMKEPVGVWGGLSELERRRILRNRGKGKGRGTHWAS